MRRFNLPVPLALALVTMLALPANAVGQYKNFNFKVKFDNSDSESAEQVRNQLLIELREKGVGTAQASKMSDGIITELQRGARVVTKCTRDRAYCLRVTVR